MRTTNPIASLLGRSPFKPMQAHMRIVNECIAHVPALFEALIAGDQAEVVKVKDLIFAKEQEADDLEHELRASLPKSLFLPVDRRDLLDLLNMQDYMADTAQDIAGLMIERDMTVPEGMAESLRELVQRCVDACDLATKIIEEMDELIEAGFGGREAASVLDMVEQLSAIEDETDEMGVKLTQILFAKEDEMKPVSVMFWYQMIQWIGDMADYAEKAGDRMRLLIAR
ncbi:MAG: TIGR00153 family protein [Gammaproteobacteria bacterium]|nr:TIGR00153 family protein [Gammaproteobacteria bacterium]